MYMYIYIYIYIGAYTRFSCGLCYQPVPVYKYNDL